MVLVFFFGVLPLQFFGFFVVLLLSGSVFGKLLCNRIFQTYWLAYGNLGYRNLLVIQGEMLPFFFRFLFRASLIILSYAGKGLSWNELRGNTATTHESYFFCFWLLFFLFRCHMKRCTDLTLGLKNALFSRSLGLRVVPELGVSFRFRLTVCCAGVLGR